ncbi:barstar family protein [Novilysobacter spongiicola]|uniref:Barstar, RNAse (Barnase) inhibitor n=1 Tax=Lysobacter spongiicola DSM 21749 TaxID=1122188 RepID=A0A1T4Q3U0_9GAMM|nr:barstar family protein [Lysobacter spongiicola]SJZ98409.1 Barstar, RNAse (barnase) inhibitor [Lysobacter spongiicola DSM 21749]
MNAVDIRAMLVDPLQSGAYFVDERDTRPMVEAGAALNLAVARIDLEGVTDKAEALRHIGKALRFPDWFGGNWDALADSLGDMSWWHAPGYLLLLEHAGQWREADQAAFDTLLAIFNEAAEEWRGQNVPFWALVPLPEETLEMLAP